MIYKGTDSTIDIDIISDLNTWAYSQLINAGFENVTLDRALYQYCDMQLRLFPNFFDLSSEINHRCYQAIQCYDACGTNS